MSYAGWLRQKGRWQRAATGESIDAVHQRLLEEAKRRGLSLMTGTRLITEGAPPRSPDGAAGPQPGPDSTAL